MVPKLDLGKAIGEKCNGQVRAIHKQMADEAAGLVNILKRDFHLQV